MTATCARVPVGAVVRVRAVFQQEKRDVVAAGPAGVSAHGCHQRVQRLVAVGRQKRHGDLVFGEEVPVMVTAFDPAPDHRLRRRYVPPYGVYRMSGTDPAATLVASGTATQFSAWGPGGRSWEGTIPMTSTDTRRQAAGTLTARTLARAGAAVLLALAGPAVSFLPALTTNIHGSGAAVTFPNGYPLMLAVTVAVTALACALGAFVARRAALVAIPLGLAPFAGVRIGAGRCCRSGSWRRSGYPKG